MRNLLFIGLLLCMATSWSQKKDVKFYSSLKVIAYHEKKKNRIPYATIKIIGTNNLSVELKANKRGEAIYDSLESGHHFTFEVSKDKFLGNSGQVSTRNLNQAKEFQVFVELITGEKVTKFPTLIFEKRNPELVQSTIDSLEYLVNIFTENPTLVFEVILNRFKDEDPSIIEKRKKVIRDYFIQHDINKKRIEFSINEQFSKGKKFRLVGNIQINSWDFEVQKDPSKRESYQIQLRFFNAITKELIRDSLKVHWMASSCPNKIEYTTTGVLEIEISDYEEKIRVHIEHQAYLEKEIKVEFARDRSFKILDVYIKPR